MTALDTDYRAKHLISAEELQRRLVAGEHIVLLDNRFNLDHPDGRPAYRSGHLPNAVYIDLPTELAGEPVGFSGRRPLPQIRDLQRDARRWGIHQNDAVVVYDDNNGLQAARAWWVLRWAGLQNVRLLDGGLGAWRRIGGVVTTETPLPDYGDVILSGGHLAVLDADAAARQARSGVLLDARPHSHYLGSEVPDGAPKEGHIPGAISAPTAETLDSDGLLKPGEALRARLVSLGANEDREIGIYCGGGVAAAHEALALATLGIEAAIFPGSWSAWSADPGRRAVVGPEPG